MIGGFSPVGGEFLTDQGELVNLAVSDFGTTLVDAQGSHFNFSPETGLVHRLESGALQRVAPEAYVIGGAAVTRVIAASSVRVFGGRSEALRAACMAASLCTSQVNAAGTIVTKPSRALVQQRLRMEEIRIGIQREQANQFRKVIRDR
ncbi:MAG: hypothetical protein LC637_03105 [Xanthomonadaceae bacterium]|nr:hypothetical protein [Xanthomonadaceae bacterium]